MRCAEMIDDSSSSLLLNSSSDAKIIPMGSLKCGVVPLFQLQYITGVRHSCCCCGCGVDGGWRVKSESSFPAFGF